MKTKSRVSALLCALFSALSVTAQPLTLDDPVLVGEPSSSSIFGPQSISGLSYWWVSEDLPLAPVTNWVDRILSLSWTNGNVATRPTNTSSGLLFVSGGTTVLTNTSGTADPGSGDCTHWFVLKSTSQTGLGDLLDRSTSDAVSQFGVDAGKIFYRIAPTQITDGLLSTQEMTSVVCASQSTGNKVTWYTNGVPSNTNTTLKVANMGWKVLGGIAANGFFKGYLTELAIWTNTTLTSVDASNLHSYASGKYGF